MAQERKVITVTSRQVQAARMLLDLDQVLGRDSDPAVVLIAEARKRARVAQNDLCDSDPK